MAIAEAPATNRKAAPLRVSVDEIGDDLLLVGRLQKPLGTLVTVRGKWSLPSTRVKDYSLRFTVTHVDDKQLQEPVEYNFHQTRIVTQEGGRPFRDGHDKSLDGVEWTLRAYETGSIELMPAGYFQETPPFGVPYYYRNFTSRLNGILQ